jgi:hypothetical protein
MMGDKEPQQMLVSHFTYEPLPQVSDGSNFQREVQVSGNAYNCFLLAPPSTNSSQLCSVAEGTQSYRFFLDDVALSNIPLQLSTTLDLDMKMRVYNNSEFPLRNLNPLKDAPIFVPSAANKVQQFVAKLKPHVMAGQPNFVAGAQPKALRVELNGNGMATAKTVYFFKEEFKVL